METLEMFDAYVQASRQLHETCVHLAAYGNGMPMSELGPMVEAGRQCEREVQTLESAIHAQLAPTHKPIAVVVSGLHHATIMRAGGAPRDYRLTGESYWRLRGVCDAHMDRGAAILGGYIWVRETRSDKGVMLMK